MSNIKEKSICLQGYINKALLAIKKKDNATAIKLLKTAALHAIEIADIAHGLERKKFVNKASDILSIIDDIKNSTEIAEIFDVKIENNNENSLPSINEDFNNINTVSVENDISAQDAQAESNEETCSNTLKKEYPDNEFAKSNEKTEIINQDNNEITSFQESKTNNASLTEEVQIEVQKTLFFFNPEVPITIEFYMNKNFDNIFLEIAGNQYVCEQHIKNWVCKEIKDIVPGTYQVVVKSDRKLLTFEITIADGIIENDIGI
jgi:hypothetical protein